MDKYERAAAKLRAVRNVTEIEVGDGRVTAKITTASRLHVLTACEGLEVRIIADGFKIWGQGGMKRCIRLEAR